MQSKSFLDFLFDVVVSPIIIALIICLISFGVADIIVSQNENNKKKESLVEKSRQEDLSEEEFDSLSIDQKLKVLYLNKSN